ncbi:MAG: hypothetical protein P4M00_19510 [Azospirillaceae bacterium]|nr:hypothetical protein [Azospirillaceae bacterium]
MSSQNPALDLPHDVVINRVPLWLAVAVTVVLSLPFGLWLGKFNFALWCSFIVWAEYFALGAKLQVVPMILESFGYAAVITGVSLAIIPVFSFVPSLLTPGDLGIAAALFIGVGFMVHSMSWSHAFQEGSLPFFNGISMALGIYFTNSFPHFGPDAFLPIVAAIWTVAMAVFGILLGIITVYAQLPAKRRA